MWRNKKPLEDATLAEFEKKFKFRIDKDLRGFLLLHNAGSPTPGTFPTSARERKLETFLDFSDKNSSHGAWAINKRLRDKIGEKRIIIGKDNTGNFICLERRYVNQNVVVWSHINNEFEASLIDIPAFLRRIG